MRCINRNIVECKGKVDYCAYAIVDGINRNIVECKVVSRTSFFLEKVVLIETSWNVKVYNQMFLVGYETY